MEVMKSAISQEYLATIELARNDADLHAQLNVLLKGAMWSFLERSEMVCVALPIIGRAVANARTHYLQCSERLKCIVIETDDSNAWAIWSFTGTDWIVLTERLLIALRDASEETAERLDEHFGYVLSTHTATKVFSSTPLQGCFKNNRSALLFAAGLGFFVGHECGHHLHGHDGFFKSRAHAEADDWRKEADSRWQVRHALELEADLAACTMSYLVLGQWMASRLDVIEVREMPQFHYLVAVLLSAGAFLALLIIRPSYDWKWDPQKTHPPAAVRALAISFRVKAKLKQEGHVSAVESSWIRIKTLDLIARSTIVSGSKSDRVFRDRSTSENLAALRAAGIRRAAYDPQCMLLIQHALDSLTAERPHLRPRYLTKPIYTSDLKQ